MDKRSIIKIHKSANTNSSIINLGKLKRVIVLHGSYSSGVNTGNLHVPHGVSKSLPYLVIKRLSNLHCCTGL